MILLNLGQDVLRDGLLAGGPVLDRQALNAIDGNPTGLDLILEQKLEHPLGFGGDEHADAVSGQDADLDRRDLRVVDPAGRGLDLLHALHLDFKEMAEVLLGSVDGGGIHFDVSSVYYFG